MRPAQRKKTKAPCQGAGDGIADAEGGSERDHGEDREQPVDDNEVPVAAQLRSEALGVGRGTGEQPPDVGPEEASRRPHAPSPRPHGECGSPGWSLKT